MESKTVAFTILVDKISDKMSHLALSSKLIVIWPFEISNYLNLEKIVFEKLLSEKETQHIYSFKGLYFNEFWR